MSFRVLDTHFNLVVSDFGVERSRKLHARPQVTGSDTHNRPLAYFGWKKSCILAWFGAATVGAASRGAPGDPFVGTNSRAMAEAAGSKAAWVF
jgi:hypothetical protein